MRQILREHRKLMRPKCKGLSGLHEESTKKEREKEK